MFEAIYMKNCIEMKLQLDEQTLNAYINEAIKQEINEGVWNRVANFATRRATRAAERAAAKNTAKVITHSPITKKVTGRIPDARRARKFIMALRRGKPVEGTLETGGKQWRAVAQKGWKPGMKSKNVEFFVKDPATQKWVKATGKDLALAKQSFSHHLTNASNLFNSAQRNMLGTGLVAGMGAGWAIDHNAHKDDPWNAKPEEDGVGTPSDGGFDGVFPWDETTPAWSPRPTTRRTTTTSPESTATTSAEEVPTQPERQRVELLAPIVTPAGISTGVTVPQQTIRPPEHNESYVDSARRVMAQTAAAGLNGNAGNPRLDNWQATNRNTRRTAIDTVNGMQASGAMSPEDARTGRRAIRQTERAVRRNGRRAQRQGQ